MKFLRREWCWIALLALFLGAIASIRYFGLALEGWISVLGFFLALIMLIIAMRTTEQIRDAGQGIENRLESIGSRLEPMSDVREGIKRIESRLERMESEAKSKEGSNPGSQLPSRPQPPSRPLRPMGRETLGGGLVGAGIGFLAGGIPGLILGAIIGTAIGNQIERNERRTPPR